MNELPQDLKLYSQLCLMKEKILFFMIEFLNLRKIILLIIFLVIKFSLNITSYQFFKNDWVFINHGLFIWGKYSPQLYSFYF